MVDRFLVWISTGVVTAGVTAAVLAGPGVAMATDGDSNDGGGTKTSESVDSPGNKDDSGAGNTSPNGPNVTGEDKQGDDPAGVEPDPDKEAIDEGLTGEDAIDEDATDETTGEDATDETTGEDLTDGTTGGDLIDEETTGANGEAGELGGAEEPELGEGVEPTETGTGSHKDLVQTGDSQIAQWTRGLVEDFGPLAKTTNENVEIKEAPEINAVEERALVNVVDLSEEATEQPETPELMSVAFAAPAAAQANAMAFASPLNVVLDIIGTIVFGLFSLVTQAVGGPPVLPLGSTVTVRSSTLRIDCGCAPGAGQSVPVDWYIPEDPEPDRFIYLQHGFLAAAPWYSHTAAALAEETKSIVVAPSINSNFLSYDQCWLGGAPMHQAMAGLFDPNNAALKESALAAGYNGAIPQRVVLMGHSLGGGAVSGIAGYMSEDGTADRLAGVVLLDGVGLNGQMANDLRKVDLDIPIYQLAAPKYMWNMFGSGTDALLQARPNADFYGVTLVGGSHVDTMRGGNFLIQFAQQLVSGFSTPQNVEAARMVMVGWVNDMFDPTGVPEGIYLERGETLTIDTPAGRATLVDLPNSLRKPFILNFLEPFMALSGGLFTLQPGCLREPTATAASCAGSVAA